MVARTVEEDFVELRVSTVISAGQFSIVRLKKWLDREITFPCCTTFRAAFTAKDDRKPPLGMVVIDQL